MAFAAIRHQTSEKLWLLQGLDFHRRTLQQQPLMPVVNSSLVKQQVTRTLNFQPCIDQRLTWLLTKLALTLSLWNGCPTTSFHPTHSFHPQQESPTTSSITQGSTTTLRCLPRNQSGKILKIGPQLQSLSAAFPFLAPRIFLGVGPQLGSILAFPNGKDGPQPRPVLAFPIR